MYKLSVFLLGVVVALTSIGCDSNEDDLSDAEIFIGTWTLVGLSDDEGDKLADFAEVADGFTATLNSDKSFHVLVDYAEGDDLELEGTYTVEEATNLLVLSSGGLHPPFNYEIENEDRIVLSANAAIVNALFETETYVGTVDIVIQRT